MRHPKVLQPDEAQACARKLLSDKYAEYEYWADVAEEFGLNRGLVYMVATGKRKASPRVLQALGIEAVVTAPAPVCPVHGVVHVGRCPRQTASDYDAWRSDPRRARKLRQMVRWAESKKGG